MKLAVTISDCGMAANVGGDVEKRTAIIELTSVQLPPILQAYLRNKAEATQRNYAFFMAASFSILEDIP